MKLLFMGTPEFSVPTLEALISAGHEVIGVITQPDKPKGRGKEMQSPPVKEAAQKHGITVYQPQKVRDPEFVKVIENLNPEAIVVIAFGQILPKAILDIPKYGCINIHASLLPKFRGSAPIQWAVIEGEKETGITTMYMDIGVDTGDMLLKKVIPIKEKETGGSLHDKLAQAGGPLIIETLSMLEEGTAVRIKQDDAMSTYAKMLDKKLGEIDWNLPAEQIERLIRGLNPWPSAYTYLHGKTLKIWDADVIAKDYAGQAGEITEITKDSIIVKTGRAALAIRLLQLEGKKKMEADSFLRGNPLNTGVIFCND